MRITQIQYKKSSCAIQEIDSSKEWFFKSFRGNNKFDGCIYNRSVCIDIKGRIAEENNLS